MSLCQLQPLVFLCVWFSFLTSLFAVFLSPTVLVVGPPPNFFSLKLTVLVSTEYRSHYFLSSPSLPPSIQEMKSRHFSGLSDLLSCLSLILNPSSSSSSSSSPSDTLQSLLSYGLGRKLGNVIAQHTELLLDMVWHFYIYFHHTFLCPR